MALVVAFTAVGFDTNLLQVQYCQGRWHEGVWKEGQLADFHRQQLRGGLS